jgi:hypothetical protein
MESTPRRYLVVAAGLHQSPRNLNLPTEACISAVAGDIEDGCQ